MDGHQVLTEVVVGSHLRFTSPGEPYQSVVWQLCPSCLLFASGNFTGGSMFPSLGAEQDRRCRVFFPSQTSEKIHFMDKPAVKLLIKQTVLNHVIMDCNFNSFKLRFKLN